MGFTIEDKHLIQCLRDSISNEYLVLTSMECLILYKHTLKILYKSKHFPPRYNRKGEWVFLLSENQKSKFNIHCIRIFIVCRGSVKRIIHKHGNVTSELCHGSKEYLFFMSIEYLIPQKHTLKILCKSKHFPRRYATKREWVFFSEHSVYIVSLYTFIQLNTGVYCDLLHYTCLFSWISLIVYYTPCLKKKLCQLIFCSFSVKYEPISLST